ncbi:hypothetical protein BSR19_11550 (plasmid) [Streptococcus salivarius]|uniref:Uncharacterized protein n=1 Tax=Streptococcus salivarius TaxID=1304 RepID=A0AB37DDD2_STRSL|nr:hypothetical protein [Streptococcus salivarius]QGU81752.1 hypothetical protein BSR19_11550 [Streptococcus salivarius]
MEISESNNILLGRLKELLYDIENYDSMVLNYSKVNEEIESLENRGQEELDSFDARHLNNFIVESIGEAPKELSRVISKMFKKKRQQNLTEIEEYAKKEELAIEQYYKVFAEERAEILRKESEQFKEELLELNKTRSNLQELLAEYEQHFSKVDFLPEKYLNSTQLVRIISYLEDYRADNIKEAINILCSEEQLEIKFKQLNTRIEDLEKSLDNLRAEVSDNLNTGLYNVEVSISNLEDEMSQLRFDLKD